MSGKRIVVVGAGAAGLMAAAFSASAGNETILLERTDDGGRKILISGGGRCNILPTRLEEARFVTDSSPHTLRNMIRSWPLAEQIEFFERELRIPLKEETETGKLFPVSDRARDVRDGLVSLVRRRGVAVRMNAFVTGLNRVNESWQIQLAEGPPLEADAVIIATGGLSVPKTGSDGTGISIVRRLGHSIQPVYPALTPLTASPAPFAELAGVSLGITISARSPERRSTATGGFLFTHRGYSGPTVLDISHVAVRSGETGTPASISVRWTPLDERAWELKLRADGTRAVRTVLREELPDRLALALLQHSNVDSSQTLAQLRREDRLRLIESLVRCPLPWNGHEGYKKAEVTGGGVSLAEVNPRTMESRLQPGLYLCGEILDAFGPIGGYNFLWAWATGRSAGLGAAQVS